MQPATIPPNVASDIVLRSNRFYIETPNVDSTLFDLVDRILF